MHELHARRAPGQARHDGRVRHAQHRHRRGLHRDRAQRPQGHACRSRSCPARSTTCPRCTTATTSTSPAGSGASARPTSTRASSTASRRRRPKLDDRLAHALRLRPGVRHGAQPLLRAGDDRPPADRVRQGRPDARPPEHRRHAAVRRADRRQPGRRRRDAGLQPVHRVVLGRRAGREGAGTRPARSASRSTIDHVANPRVELEEHYYNPVHTKLPSLGLEPHAALGDADRVGADARSTATSTA